MGTVNYSTSQYVTVGYDCRTEYARDDFWTDEQEQRNFEIEFLQEQTEKLLGRYDFSVFGVKICQGYYEGFSVDLDPDIPAYFDSWQDKRDAQKEVTAVKRFLLDCIDLGLVVVRPGWCTGYLSPEESRETVAAAVKRMRYDVQNTPTRRNYKRAAG